MDDKDIQQEVNKMIADVELPHKRTALAKDLSGFWNVIYNSLFIQWVDVDFCNAFYYFSLR